MSLLEVRDLEVSFATEDGLVQAVRGISFDVIAGRTLGIVGESGSGKSVATQTIVGLTPDAHIAGSARFEGRELLGLGPEQLRQVRGSEIAMVFQDPLSSLHPHYRVGWQIAELVRAHTRASRKQARERAIELLRRVGIPRPDVRVDDYPHQFSGGMRQRAMIAMALALHPKLLIADEPTTALDVTVQAQVIDLLRELQAELGMAIILITHDLGIVAEIADEVMVMYAGQAVEHAKRRDIYYQPRHPYTKGLLASLPAAVGTGRRLTPIAGLPPSLIRLPQGCAFQPRCAYAIDRCVEAAPALERVDAGDAHRAACWRAHDLEGGTVAR